MEITKRQIGEALEVKVVGRLDGYWADHLTKTLDETLREGADRIQLNLSEVTFLSSAGIRVLVMFYKQLKSLQGDFIITKPSEQVKKVIELAGLKALLGSAVDPKAPAPPQPPKSRHLDLPSATFEVFDYAPGASLKCEIVGSPAKLSGCKFTESDCHSMSFPEPVFGLGLGAFGDSFADCQERFGEFLAVAGAGAYLPTDGTNVPDYVITTGTMAPELKVLYGLACEGQFAQLARFEAKRETGAATIAEIVDACADIAGSDQIGLVMLAESAGLMGAALRRSPALSAATGSNLFGFPDVRQWLSFSAERSHARALTLIAGVATRGENASLAPLVRPLGAGALAGHFHAAVFPYRPLKKGQIDLKLTVAGLFEGEALRDLLHLLGDDRKGAGGQSEFVRGACWIGPISAVSAR